MFTNYKMAFLNYSIMIISIPVITMIQNSLWPSLSGIKIPVYLWIPCLIYWGLYRKTTEAVFMVYFITLNIASTSSLPAGYLLTFNSSILLILLLFKRIYYTSLIFFSTACAASLFFFPILLWSLSWVIDGKTYFHGFILWLGGGITTWILSFPLLGVFQWIDNITAKSIEYRKMEAL